LAGKSSSGSARSAAAHQLIAIERALRNRPTQSATVIMVSK
jgi:hypothetical protein